MNGILVNARGVCFNLLLLCGRLNFFSAGAAGHTDVPSPGLAGEGGDLGLREELGGAGHPRGGLSLPPSRTRTYPLLGPVHRSRTRAQSLQAPRKSSIPSHNLATTLLLHTVVILGGVFC